MRFFSQMVIFSLLTCFSILASADPIPHVSGPDREVTEFANAGSEYMIIEFSSAFCIKCRANVPKILALANAVRGSTETKYVLVNERRDAINFSQEFNITIPIAIDTFFEVSEEFDVFETPTLLILSKSKNVIYRHEGLLSDANINEIIDRVSR